MEVYMKTKILLLVCFSLFVAGFGMAQGLENHNKDRETLKDSDRRTVELFKKLTIGQNHQLIRFKAANENLLERVEVQSWQEPDFVPYFRNDFSYQNGQRVASTVYMSSFQLPPDWTASSRELFSYSNGLIDTVIEQEFEDDDFVNDWRSVYSYQQVGGMNVIDTEYYQEWDSSEEEWVNYQRAQFIAENGEIVRLEESYWDADEEEWELEDRTLITHEGNNLFFTYQERGNNDDWENLYRDVYPNLTFMELYEAFLEVFVERVFLGSNMMFYTIFPDFTEQIWDGEDWEDEYRIVSTTTTDQATGQVTERSITEEYYFDGEWETEMQIRIEYEDGRPAVYTMYELDFVGDSEQMVAVMREDHTFNDQNLLAQVLQYSLFMDEDEMEEELSGRTVFNYSGVSTSIEPDTRPVAFSLGNAYPNPFNPTTVIPFQAGSAGHVSIRVYDMLGRYVATLADDVFQAGNHQVQFDASGLASGVYMIRMHAPGLQQVRRVSLVK